ncbi:uncharacterized protein LOC125225091 isoform X3 [Leguminivora glycinivorella]|uniref:uncharacterized protein LOC125225091 isoform X3 n=1 Tax=Leguminivora glycinivorella TaxID=1035111 RepID=UPI00200FFE3B|nr:uncharacterized protein LOC125225091 isoform X3 [Leguminivora glycinivorella]
MNRLILISAVCMQFGWIFGAPNPAGVGAYAYQDSDGNRYGGTYGLRDDQLNRNFNPVPFGPDFDDFFPEYFRNFENILQEFPFNGGWGNYGMPNFGAQNFGAYGHNSAYASGSAMPGFSHQVVAINPANPGQPNVDIKNRFGEEGTGTGTGGNGGYMSVSSSSYATSSNVNGQEKNHRGAETVVNNNGVVHRYKVES